MGSILGFISSYQIAGMIPLDLVLHLTVGMIWTIVGLRKDVSFGVLFIGLFIIAAAKEFNDYFFHYKTNYTEYLYDFLITISYIVILFFVRKLKAKLEKSEKPVEKYKIY